MFLPKFLMEDLEAAAPFCAVIAAVIIFAVMPAACCRDLCIGRKSSLPPAARLSPEARMPLAALPPLVRLPVCPFARLPNAAREPRRRRNRERGAAPP